MKDENIALNDEAQRLLNEVDQSVAAEPVIEPSAEAETEASVRPITLEEAAAMSAMLVDAAANWAEGHHPALEGRYPVEVRTQVTERLTPVVKKYDGQLPAWVLEYHAEIMLAICLGGIVYGSLRAIRDYKEPVILKTG